MKSLNLNLKSMMELNRLICGKMLGDGSINLSNNGKSARFIIKHTRTDKDYVLDQFNFFSELGLEFQSNCPRDSSQYDNRTNKTYYHTECVSLTYDFLADLYKIWHDTSNPEKPKIIPRDFVYENFDEKALAFWYQDDGSLYRDPYKIILSTDCFVQQGDVEFLIKLLEERFGIHGSIDGQNRIAIYKERDVHLLQTYVSKYLSKQIVRKNLDNLYADLINNIDYLNSKEEFKFGEVKKYLYYLPEHLYIKIVGKGITIPMLNTYLSKEISAELIKIQNNSYRQQRIKNVNTESSTNKSQIRMKWYPRLTAYNSEGLKILHDWTGLEISEYLSSFFEQISEIPKLVLTHNELAKGLGMNPQTLRYYLKTHYKHLIPVTIGKIKVYPPEYIDKFKGVELT